MNKKTKNIKKYDLEQNPIVIYKDGIYIYKSLLEKHNILKRINNRFTLTVDKYTYKERIKNYKSIYDKDIMIYPRFGFLKYIKKHFINYNLVNKIKEGEIPKIKFKWTGKFKNNQPIIAEHIMSNIFTKENAKNGKSGLILNLQAGQGKTFLATGLIEKLKRKTLIICHNRTILFQWYNILLQAYPENNIGLYYGEAKEDGDIVVAVINSLLLDIMEINGEKTTSKLFFKRFGYTIIDEAHEYCSKTRRNIYTRASSTYMLGLSATPLERKDGMDIINVWGCGDVLDAKTIKGYTEEDIAFKGEVVKINYTGPKQFTQLITIGELDTISHSLMINQISDDFYRIHMIVKLTYELIRESKNIFIFADRREYLEKIRNEMTRFNIYTEIHIDDVKANRIVGGATDLEIKKAEEGNVILTTYQFMGTGKSIPKMDAVILAHPRKSKCRQYVGRIFRLGSDYSITRKIYDIIDCFAHFPSQWYIRKKYYDEQKYSISYRNVNYKDILNEMLEMGILNTDDQSDEIAEETYQIIEENNNVENKSIDELIKLLEKKMIFLN